MFVIALLLATPYLVFEQVNCAKQGVHYLTEKPEYLTPCMTNDSRFIACSTTNIQNLWKVSLNEGGIPGFHVNFPKLDPFYIPRVEATRDDGTQAINIKMNLTNVIVKGLNSIEVLESWLNLNISTSYSKLFLPKLFLSGDYDLQGKILLLNLNGMGKMAMEAGKFDLNVQTTYNIYKRDKFHFLNITGNKVDYTLKEFKIHFDNMFNGNKELGDAANSVFNENWRIFSDALKPVLQRTIAGLLTNLSETVFRYIPVNYIVIV